ncbi:MAG: type II toxin-antitoxin system Phd/YefM family antitoxin [Anaerolineae bacterium]|nr:type II toxin-antitoxin system Phd/YefM family antitoxin [Anaerolineae bacterium]
METITAIRAQSSLQELLRSTIREHKLYRIAAEDGGAVLLSEAEYESLIETLELLSQPGLYESIKQADKEIREGDTYSLDEVFGEA